MSKSSLFKILIVFWAVALIVVGVIRYKKSKSCSSCGVRNTFYQTLSDSQKEKLKNRHAVILIPDNADPIYVDEETAYNDAQIAAFSFAQTVTITEEEIQQAMNSLMFRKYLELTPVELRPLLRERKLDVLLSKEGVFFTVALLKYLEDY
jgi:hypothetical protein